MTAWRNAIGWGNQKTLQQIWVWAKANLTTEEITNKLLLASENMGMNAWHSASMWENLELMQEILEFAKENPTT